jgi:hypothetical protein
MAHVGDIIPTSPASKAFAIAPNDSTDLAFETRGIYVGGAGDISVILTQDSAAVTFAAVPAGSLLPLSVKRVRATGTTATNLVGVY